MSYNYTEFKECWISEMRDLFGTIKKSRKETYLKCHNKNIDRKG